MISCYLFASIQSLSHNIVIMILFVTVLFLLIVCKVIICPFGHFFAVDLATSDDIIYT